MAKPEQFPQKIRVQSVVVKIYRLKSTTTASGLKYCLAWVGANGSERKAIADLDAAKEEASLRANQLAAGIEVVPGSWTADRVN